MLESDQPPYTALIVDMLPTNISNPAVIANTYKMGFSIPQNVECVKYQVVSSIKWRDRKHSYMIKITKPKGTTLEGQQIFSHVHFGSYYPLLRFN
jgi:hypothetical protein